MKHCIGQMTVGQLREKLSTVPDDYVIYSEGCDCLGPSDDIEVHDDDRSVTINRNDRLEWND